MKKTAEDGKIYSNAAVEKGDPSSSHPPSMHYEGVKLRFHHEISRAKFNHASYLPLFLLQPKFNDMFLEVQQNSTTEQIKLTMSARKARCTWHYNTDDV